MCNFITIDLRTLVETCLTGRNWPEPIKGVEEVDVEVYNLQILKNSEEFADRIMDLR